MNSSLTFLVLAKGHLNSAIMEGFEHSSSLTLYLYPLFEKNINVVPQSVGTRFAIM